MLIRHVFIINLKEEVPLFNIILFKIIGLKVLKAKCLNKLE